MPGFTDNVKACIEWFVASTPANISANICPSRDTFEARWSALLAMVTATPSGPLLAAVIGEVGLNSFDHNLGRWRDVPGCWFHYAIESQIARIVIADRGQGIRASLQSIQPQLKSDEEALRVAFEVKISGRAPEKRGNGLKFVRTAINGNRTRGLLCFSGSGKIALGETRELEGLLQSVPVIRGQGVLSFVQWGLST